MKTILIPIRDNEDFDYIYGVLVLKSNIFDTKLFQRRLNEIREELGYEDYNGVNIVEEVLKRYEKDYKDIKFVGLSMDNLYV